MACNDYTAKGKLCEEDPKRKGWTLGGCQAVGANSSATCTTTSYKLGFAKCECKPGFKLVKNGDAAGANACNTLQACSSYNKGGGFKCQRIKECTDKDWKGKTCSKADVSKTPAKSPSCEDVRPDYEWKVGHACHCPKNSKKISHFALQLISGGNDNGQ